MGRITAIRSGRRSKRVKIFLDGQAALSLGAGAAASLKVGQELPDEAIEGLAGADRFQRCLDGALRYLAYRPRSEFELRERLKQRGFDGKNIDGVVARLKERGLIDDLAFSRFWRENRESFNPRSRRLTRLELKRKGVSGEVISEAVQAMDDAESAYRAALVRANRLPHSDYQVFLRRLGGFLRRRGFNYETVSKTVRRLWEETGGGAGEGTD